MRKRLLLGGMVACWVFSGCGGGEGTGNEADASGPITVDASPVDADSPSETLDASDTDVETTTSTSREETDSLDFGDAATGVSTQTTMSVDGSTGTSSQGSASQNTNTSGTTDPSSAAGTSNSSGVGTTTNSGSSSTSEASEQSSEAVSEPADSSEPTSTSTEVVTTSGSYDAGAPDAGEVDSVSVSSSDGSAPDDGGASDPDASESSETFPVEGGVETYVEAGLELRDGGAADAADGVAEGLLDASEAGIDDAGGLDASDALVDASSLDAAVPSLLTSLQVIGGRYGLKPAFDPNTFRYSIVANTEGEVLDLILDAEPSATVSVNGTPVVVLDTVSATGALPGSDITIAVTNGQQTTEYVIKYLPVGFPNLVVTKPTPGASTDPLYTNLAYTNSQYAVKLDNNGVPYFYQRQTDRIFDVKKHPNGQMSYALWEDPTLTGVTQIVFDADYQEIARMKSVGLTNTDNHEFLILPNGNYVFIAYERATRDLTPFGGGAAVEVRDSVFQEVSPDMQVLFQWNSWDHTQYDNSYYAFGPVDYGHMNSIVVDDDDNWLVSFRGFSQVMKINRTTGDVIWRLGGIDSDFTFINDPYNGVCGQHTASRLENGHILIFDNGRDCVSEILGSRQNLTRIVEYALDEEAMTAELVWSYSRSGFYARSQGSAQRLDNGNTVIGWGNGPAAVATELDPNGNVVFELTARQGSDDPVCYRARRFAD